MLLTVSFTLKKEGEDGPSGIGLSPHLTEEDHKFKATLDNVARYCLKNNETEASNVQLHSRVLASHAQVKSMFGLQH